jgi:LacI family transcriptional regulator
LNDYLTKVNVDDLLAGTVEAASEVGVYPIVRMAGLRAGEPTIRAIVDLIGGGVFATLVQTPSPELEEAVRDRLMHDNLVGLVFPRRYSEWEFNAIDADNVRIAEVAAELLTLQGRRRWAIVYDDSGCEGLTVRQESLKRAADEAGIPVESIVVPCGTNHLKICDLLVSELERSHLDGLFAPTLMGSVGALLACRRLGVIPGEDLAIIGSDCLRWPAESLPQVTSVDVSWNDAGKVATQRLLELREEGEHRFDNILLAPRVIPGNTCRVPDGFPAVESPPIPPLDAATAP